MQSFETRLWLWALNARSRLAFNTLERSLPDLRPALINMTFPGARTAQHGLQTTSAESFSSCCLASACGSSDKVSTFTQRRGLRKS